MAVRVLEIAAPAQCAERVEAALTEAGALDVWRSAARDGEDRRVMLRALVETGRQDPIDAAQNALAGYEGWRILILPVEAAIPKPDLEERDGAEAERRVRAEAREVLYNSVSKGARIDLAYVLFVVFSTIVAAAALIGDNVAVLIGAMVIAPFLGPNLAFSLGAALGDRELMQGALKAFGAGLAIALAMSALVSLISPETFSSKELLDRTDVGFDGILIALASGAAAALALTTGQSSSLVGVMVAVALLPPAATVGLMIGDGRWGEAFGALTLLLANVACVNLAALAIFRLKGIEPRRWLEKLAARQSRRLAWMVWGALLALLVATITLRQLGFGL